MTIETSDLVLRHSQRLTDNDDGGGAMTATEVADGDVNALFPPLSRADRVHGEVAMRKIFLHCQSANTDALYGANLLLAADSADDNTSVLMFEGSAFDERAEAVEQIMQAAVKGELIRLDGDAEQITYDDQFSGQARILLQPGISVSVGENLFIELDWADDVYMTDLARGGEYVQIDSIEQVSGFQIVTLRDALQNDYPFEAVGTNGSGGSVTVYPTFLRRCFDNSGLMRYKGVSALASGATAGTKTLELTHADVQVLPVAETSQAVAASGYEAALTSSVAVLSRADFVADGFYLVPAGSGLTQIGLPVTADGNINARITDLTVRNDITGSTEYPLLNPVIQNGISINLSGPALSAVAVAFAVDGGRNKRLAGADLTDDGSQITGVTVPSGGLVKKSFVMAIDGSTDVITDDGTGRLVRMDTSGVYTAIVGTVDYATGAISSSSADMAASKTSNLLYCYGVDLSVPLQTSFALNGAYSLPFAVTATRISDDATLTANITTGGVTGDATGSVIQDGGSVWASVAFSDSVYASSISTGEVSISSVAAIDPEAVGLSALRMPADGRLPIIQSNDWLTLHDSQNLAIANLSAGQTITLPRQNLSLIQLFDSTGARLAHSLYSVDLAAGTLTMATPLDLSGYASPFTAVHVIEENVLAQSVSGTAVTLVQALTNDWSAGALVSSVLELGDLQARYSNLFDQANWTDTWSDSAIGDGVSDAGFDDINNPIQVTNQGAFTERWALEFVNASTVRVFGEHIGNLGDWLISNDIAPTNPATGAAYFTVPAAGWGDGWSVGNVLRFNTVGAAPAVWLVRAVQPGVGTVDDDGITLMPRGDVA